MTPEEAAFLSAGVTTVGGLFTFAVARWDKNRGSRDKRDAKVLQVEQLAFERATAIDVDLIARLSDRLDSAERRAEEAENRAVKLGERVYKLERAMAAAGLPIPT